MARMRNKVAIRGEDVDMAECVGVFQGMGDEVAVLAVVVIDAAVSMLFVCR